MSDRFESRVPCPVCLAGKMTRTPVAAAGRLALDHCERCGGVWFDGGEVAALRAAGPAALLTRIRPRPESYRMRCRSCDAFVDRDASACLACGHDMVLDCPRCDDAMETAAVAELRLDLCRGCGGVWLDNHELKEIWKLGLARLAGAGTGDDASESQARGSSPTAARAPLDPATSSAELFLYTPHVVFDGVDAAGHALASGAEVGVAGLGPALEAIGAGAEATFELIVHAVSSVL